MSYRDTILGTTGLFAFWEFAETAGTTAADTKGTDAGTYGAGCTLGQPGIPGGGKSVLFSGGATAKVTTALTFNQSTFSLECWVYLTAYPTADGTVLADVSPSTRDKQIYIKATTGRPGLYVYSGGDVYAEATAGLSLNTWHHLLGSCGPAGTFLYVDGVQAATAPAATSSYTGFAAPGLQVNGASTFSPMAARQAYPAAYTTQLAGAVALAHWGAGSTPPPAGNPLLLIGA